MCTLVILRRPGHAWPVLIGANRDEMKDRRWRPPGRHWPDLPVVAGQDISGGGTWQGVNDAGLQAAVLNRFASLGPAPGKRSRGELPLLALAHGDAETAAQAIAELDAGQFRPFNLLLADKDAAFWLAGLGQGGIAVRPVPEGLSMLTAHDLNDIKASPRMAHNLPRFAKAQVPDPAMGDWRAWQDLLAFKGELPPDPEHFDIRADAVKIQSSIGFQTVSSSLIALPAEGKPLWWFDAGQGPSPVLL
ncbi:NRDE family protein [Gallaecimonas kandeliae]|uniref:NRDE family protein n=1 Tax=Gallaecimonas kandeliae TaxID=3029055 RepID=UPI0026482DA5|nr:NRDE family protein [Gallaecimonas kandeliae]WKE64642.1 NRDE family protein [Gallaecimonas kandeliae]